MKTIVKTSLIFLLAWGPLLAKAGATEDLFAALYKADLPAIQSAIAAGADVNAVHQNGFTPLLLSMWYPDITAELIKAKADVNKSTHNNAWTPLTFACSFGSFETIVKLVEAGADINATTNSIGGTAWLAAVPLYRVDVLKYLASKGADTKTLNGYNQDALMLLAMFPKTAVTISAYYKSLEDGVVKAGNPVPPMIKKLQDEALYDSMDKMLDYLLSIGFDMNKETDLIVPANLPNAEKINKDNKKAGLHQSVITIARTYGNAGIIKAFIAKGGNIVLLKKPFPFGYHIKIFMASTISDADMFFIAVKSGDIELAKTLLANNIGSVKQQYVGFFFTSLCNKQFKIEKLTPLMVAANEGNLAMCQFLVEQGAKGMDKCTLAAVGSIDPKSRTTCGEYLVKRALNFPENFATSDEVSNYLKTLKK